MEVQYPEAFAVVAGNTPEEEVASLRRCFPHVVFLPPDPTIAEPVAYHPDMLFAVVGDVLVTHAMYYEGAQAAVDEICALGGFTLRLSHMARGRAYPADVGFNALVYGKYLVANVKHLSLEVLALSDDEGMETIHVKQGYSACTVLAVPEVNLAATADAGAAKALAGVGVDVVGIPTDVGIALPGYDCGFIGGCTGVWGGTVFFSGDPKLHCGLAVLLNSLTERGVETVVLSKNRLTDRGGVRVFARRG